MLSRTRSAVCVAFLLLPAWLTGCEDQATAQGTAPIEQDDEGMEDEERVCIEGCDPVEQDCDFGEACLPDQPGFSCQNLPVDEEGSGVRRRLHDPCEVGSQACDPGLVCLPVAAPGCSGSSGCCVAICDTNRSECTEGTQCYPFFEESLECYPEVGACVLF